jgi:hypothetical protein
MLVRPYRSSLMNRTHLAIAFALAATSGCQRAATTPTVVTILAHEYALQLPDTLPAGLTTVRLQNDGKAPHEAAFVRLDGDKTPADVITAMNTPGPDPAWMHWVGGPAAFPGRGLQTVTLTLAPGRYVVICGVPGPDGHPHAMSGMYKTLTVVPSSRVVAAPVTDVAVTMVDYDYKWSTPISAGTHTIGVTNAATQGHHMIVVRLAPGKSIPDLLTWFGDGKGPPPMTWGSGVTSLSPGTTAYLTANFLPGTYALLCFLSDVGDGKPHIAHGMQQQLTVE